MAFFDDTTATHTDVIEARSPTSTTAAPSIALVERAPSGDVGWSALSSSRGAESRIEGRCLAPPSTSRTEWPPRSYLSTLSRLQSVDRGHEGTS